MNAPFAETRDREKTKHLSQKMNHNTQFKCKATKKQVLHSPFGVCAVVSHQLIKLQLICHSSSSVRKIVAKANVSNNRCSSLDVDSLGESVSEREKEKESTLLCAKNLQKVFFPFISFATSVSNHVLLCGKLFVWVLTL